MQLIDLIDTYSYGLNKDLVCKKEEVKYVKYNKTIQKYLIFIILQKKT